jgi:hypothetical protein
LRLLDIGCGNRALSLKLIAFFAGLPVVVFIGVAWPKKNLHERSFLSLSTTSQRLEKDKI